MLSANPSCYLLSLESESLDAGTYGPLVLYVDGPVRESIRTNGNFASHNHRVSGIAVDLPDYENRYVNWLHVDENFDRKELLYRIL